MGCTMPLLIKYSLLIYWESFLMLEHLVEGFLGANSISLNRINNLLRKLRKWVNWRWLCTHSAIIVKIQLTVFEVLLIHLLRVRFTLIVLNLWRAFLINFNTNVLVVERGRIIVRSLLDLPNTLNFVLFMIVPNILLFL
jgi:hypothetical protein